MEDTLIDGRKLARVCDGEGIDRDVPCDLCGKPAVMIATRRCNECWEIEWAEEMRQTLEVEVE